MDSSKKTTILIGLGRIATFYVEGLRDSNYYDLVYVCDKNPRAEAKALYENLTCEFVENYLEVFENKAVEVAIIATPPCTHARIIADCHNYGVLPVVEKPVADSEYDFNRLLGMKIPFKTMFHWKYGSEVLYFKENILPNVKIKSIAISIQDPYLDDECHVRKEYLHKAGCWIDSGVNALSLISTLFGGMGGCWIKSYHEVVDKKSGQPYEAACDLRHGFVSCTISVKWNQDTDCKTTEVVTDKGLYILNHSRQEVLCGSETIFHNSDGLERHRLGQHYFNLFARPVSELDSGLEVAAIHKFLYKPVRNYKAHVSGYLSNAKRKLVDFFFESDEKKNKMKILLCLVCLAGLLLPIFLHEGANAFFSVGGEVIKTLCAFLLSAIAFLGTQIFFKYIEDRQKVHSDNDQLEKMYGTAYRHDFLLNGSFCSVYHDSCWTANTEKTEFRVDDDPNKMFIPDEFIRGNELEILKAHGGSVFNNWETVRLDDYMVVQEDNTRCLTLNTSRSTYLAHMITNRAIDYKIAGVISLRQKYEFAKALTPLSKSAFSNHLGLIGLVVLTGGEEKYMLFPHRGSTGTISKNMITSGVAMPLLAEGNIGFKDDVPFKSYIFERLQDAMKVGHDFLESDDVKISMIGLGRDVYEGGKPSCFYIIEVEKAVEEYYKAFKKYRETDGASKLDYNKTVYVAHLDSIMWQKHGEMLSFIPYSPNGEGRRMNVVPEKNLVCNLLHYVRSGRM